MTDPDRLVPQPEEPTNRPELVLVADGRKCDATVALAELDRLVDDLKVAHRHDNQLRALSNLVALKPLIGHLSSLKQERMTDDQFDAPTGGNYL